MPGVVHSARVERTPARPTTSKGVRVSIPETPQYRPALLERLSPLGGLIYGLAILWAFFASDDYGDTPQSVVDYADANQSDLWFSAIVGLATPLLIGLFVAGLAARLAPAARIHRNLVLMGGTLFAALATVGLTIWSAPLLDDNLDASTAATYLALDDFGWVILGAGGVGMGLMIIGASLAALELRWVPAWLGWVGVALGVAAFASVAAVGLFAWVAWLIAASVLMLVRGNRAPGSPTGPAPTL